MRTILVTGATGNIGKAVIHHLLKASESISIKAGARKAEEIKSTFPASEHISPTLFDFEKPDTFAQALAGCDSLFLLRPPQISEVKKYFEPIIEEAKIQGINHIIFLSVQGVEKSSIIPHHKIEKLIVESGIPYTFLRPAYFMQNFTTTLKKDIIEKQIIFLPAGKAKFTLIDVDDVGKAAVPIIIYPEQHVNKAYELTNEEQLSFTEMAAKISKGVGREIRFISPNLLRFYLQKRKEGIPGGFILVMIMLHYLPRFQQTPQTTGWIYKLTGQKPKSFTEFIKEHKNALLKA
ncbi:NmrA family NAD(P)-binding protein [Marivirga sp. S37H4]|uniref:NmrA family NAD(P)-binding protein n=1 Tax=Marivirga aurantiaca TaxID=2802615 RepID=A0A935CBJ6_9BACT|nr:NmrA family NAD(P)-binding protein [Marivirga aurantiaca]MBK6267356.1 NmrA family NAD(P)-binding protein [Marivirga aurantiaca]